MELNNIFKIEIGSVDGTTEIFEELEDDGKVRIERIISTGQRTPMGEWLVQEKNEFVLLLSGKACLEFKSGQVFEMLPGDHLTIAPMVEHRVNETREDPPTIWLAVHY